MIRLVSPIAAVGWVSSLAIHVAIAAWLQQATHREPTHRAPAVVTLSVVAPSRVNRSTAGDDTKERSPDEPRARSSAPIHPREMGKQSSRVPSDPVDLTGVTLTGGDGTGWASMTGDGLSMGEPIRPTAGTVAASAVAVPSNSPKLVHRSPPLVEVVPAKDLATRPTPPALNVALLANYPPLAKQQGIAGHARLLVRIDADGVVRRCTIESASTPEFGVACRQTLLGSRWSTPRDRLGNAVTTQVYYTCDFRVSGS